MMLYIVCVLRVCVNVSWLMHGMTLCSPGDVAGGSSPAGIDKAAQMREFLLKKKAAEAAKAAALGVTSPAKEGSGMSASVAMAPSLSDPMTVVPATSTSDASSVPAAPAGAAAPVAMRKIVSAKRPAAQITPAPAIEVAPTEPVARRIQRVISSEVSPTVVSADSGIAPTGISATSPAATAAIAPPVVVPTTALPAATIFGSPLATTPAGASPAPVIPSAAAQPHSSVTVTPRVGMQVVKKAIAQPARATNAPVGSAAAGSASATSPVSATPATAPPTAVSATAMAAAATLTKSGTSLRPSAALFVPGHSTVAAGAPSSVSSSAAPASIHPPTSTPVATPSSVPMPLPAGSPGLTDVLVTGDAEIALMEAFFAAIPGAPPRPSTGHPMLVGAELDAYLEQSSVYFKSLLQTSL
jgi:hypothetical protein